MKDFEIADLKFKLSYKKDDKLLFDLVSEHDFLQIERGKDDKIFALVSRGVLLRGHIIKHSKDGVAYFAPNIEINKDNISVEVRHQEFDPAILEAALSKQNRIISNYSFNPKDFLKDQEEKVGISFPRFNRGISGGENHVFGGATPRRRSAIPNHWVMELGEELADELHTLFTTAKNYREDAPHAHSSACTLISVIDNRVRRARSTPNTLTRSARGLLDAIKGDAIRFKEESALIINRAPYSPAPTLRGSAASQIIIDEYEATPNVSVPPPVPPVQETQAAPEQLAQAPITTNYAFTYSPNRIGRRFAQDVYQTSTLTTSDVQYYTAQAGAMPPVNTLTPLSQPLVEEEESDEDDGE